MKALQDRRVWEWQSFMHQQLWVYNGLSTAVCKNPNSQVSVWITLCRKQKRAQVNGSWMLINWCHFSAVCHGDLAGLGTWSRVAGKELGQLFTFSNPPYSILHLHNSQKYHQHRLHQLRVHSLDAYFGRIDPYWYLSRRALLTNVSNHKIADLLPVLTKLFIEWLAGQKGWHWATLSAGTMLTFKTSEYRGLQSIMSKLVAVFGSMLL